MRLPLALAVALLIAPSASAATCADLHHGGRTYTHVAAVGLGCHAAHTYVKAWVDHGGTCRKTTFYPCGYGEPRVFCLQRAHHGYTDVLCSQGEDRSLSFRYAGAREASLSHPPGPPPPFCDAITIDGRNYGNIASQTLACHTAHEWIRGWHAHQSSCGTYVWKDCGFGEPPGSVQCTKVYVSGLYDVQCRHKGNSVSFRYSPRSAGGGL